MEDYSQNNSSSSSHYSNLLATVSELRSDLEKTISKMNALEEQNKSLQMNYQAVKDELITTRKKYNEAKDNYMITAAAKIESERVNEAFMEKVKYQLTEKTKEFEALREKFAPQDIDFVRIKVQEELEIPHRQKIQYLENEIENHKEMYYQVKRDFERSKVENEIANSNFQREMFSLRDEYESNILQLRKQISELQFREYTPEKDDKIRIQRMKMTELETSLKMAMEELLAMRQAKDNLHHSSELMKTGYENRLSDMKGKLIVSEAERHSLEQRLHNMSASYANIEHTLKTCRQSAEDTEKSLWVATQSIGDKDVQLKLLRQTHSGEIEAISVLHNSQYDELQSKYECVCDKLDERESLVRRIQRETNELQIRMETHVMEQKKGHQLILSEYKAKCDAMELEIVDLRHLLSQTENNQAQVRDQCVLENDKLRSEVSRINREKEILHQQVRSLDQKYVSERARLAEVKLTSDETSRLLKVQIGTLESELKAMKIRMDDSKEESKHLKEMNRQMESKSSEVVENIKRETEKKYEELGHVYRLKLEESKKKLLKAVVKERKRGDSYKDHALEAHRRSKALTTAAMAVASGDQFAKDLMSAQTY